MQVASDSFHRGMVHSWAMHPGARGCYAYPGVGTTGCREALARPVADRVFFAGEAVNLKSCGNVSSALESGHHAAEAIAASFWRARL